MILPLILRGYIVNIIVGQLMPYRLGMVASRSSELVLKTQNCKNMLLTNFLIFDFSVTYALEVTF